MVRSLKGTLLAGLFMVLGGSALVCQEYDLDGFRSVIGAGGMVSQVSSNGNYVLSGMIGQTVIENRTSDSYILSQGFWVNNGDDESGVEDGNNLSLNNGLSNSPNPFSVSTNIGYELPGSAFVTVKVYDAVGNLVKTVFEGYQNGGSQQLSFDGTDNTNTTLSSGSYMCELNVRPAAMAGGSSFQSYTVRNIMVIVR